MFCRFSYRRTSLLLVWALLHAPVGFGLDSDTARAGDERDQLQEIVVTSQRRAESSQLIPMAVQVVSDAQLQRMGVTDTLSLTMAVPGLTYALAGNNAAPFLRGIGTSITTVGTDPSVSTYVDGVYVGSIQGSLFDLNNIDRVEVLKGPQGTLFGRNATGGIIQVVTKTPSQTPSADLQVGYANYATSTASFYGTTGLADNLAINLAAYGTHQRDGWGSDLVTGDPAFTRHDYGVRSKLLWTPDTGTSLLVAVDYSRTRDEDGLGFHVVPPGIALDGTTRYGGFYNTYDDPNDSSDIWQGGVSIKAEQPLGFARLGSISAWRYVKGRSYLDEEGMPSELLQNTGIQRDRAISEELHLVSDDGASVPWIAGVYYFNDQARYAPIALRGLFIAPLAGVQIRGLLGSRSYAAFGQASPEIATATHLTLGARFTEDQQSLSGSTIGVTESDTVPLGSASQHKDSNKITWRMSLDHRFGPNVMVYLADDRGFKSGTFNAASYTDPPVQPEILDAYQMGIKSEFLEHRLRLNASLFYYNYKDIQVQQVVNGAVRSVNAAAARLQGLDMDFSYLPAEGLSIQGGLVWMGGHYNEFNDAQFFRPTLNAAGVPVGGNTLSIGDASGFETVRTPKETATLSATYRISIPGGVLALEISNYFNSGFAWDPDNRLRQPRYDLLNASLEWQPASKNMGVRIWGRNLSGAHYCTFETESAFLDDCSPGAPATYGVTLSAHF